MSNSHVDVLLVCTRCSNKYFGFRNGVFCAQQGLGQVPASSCSSESVCYYGSPFWVVIFIQVFSTVFLRSPLCPSRYSSSNYLSGRSRRSLHRRSSGLSPRHAENSVPKPRLQEDIPRCIHQCGQPEAALSWPLSRNRKRRLNHYTILYLIFLQYFH
jgi:hypothetical protein